MSLKIVHLVYECPPPSRKSTNLIRFYLFITNSLSWSPPLTIQLHFQLCRRVSEIQSSIFCEKNGLKNLLVLIIELFEFNIVNIHSQYALQNAEKVLRPSTSRLCSKRAPIILPHPVYQRFLQNHISQKNYKCGT